MKNTKLTFYCTHAEYGEFKKTIFDAVLPGLVEIEDIYDARNWVDEEVSTIYSDFDLDLVFDWVVVDFHKTNDDVKSVNILDTVSGKLVFDDDIIKTVKKPRAKKSKVKEFDTTPVKKKTYKSVWIDTLGKSYEVAFACHNDFAAHWLKLNDKAAWKASIDSNDYYYEILQKRGWCRILGWTSVPTFVLPSDIRPKMKNALRDYCVSNSVEYKDYPEILKNK